MNKFSKIILLGLAITIMGNMVVGCSKKETMEKQTKQAELVMEIEKGPVTNHEETVTLRTASQFGGLDPAKEIYEAKLDAFKNENPNIFVEDESGVAGQMWKAKVATDFLVNNEPDVLYTFTGKNAESIIEQGKVVSIGEIRKEYPQYASNILESILKLVEEFDGNTYAVPVRGYYEGLFINKAIFNEYGLALPTDWEKLETAIITLNEKGIVPIAAALGQAPDHWIEHLILSQGGVEIGKNTDIMAVKRHWVKGLEYFKILYDLGGFPKDTNVMSNEQAIGLFANGDAAMLLEKSQVTSQFKNSDDIMVLPFPTVPGGKKDPSHILSDFEAGWYITKKAWDDPARRVAAVKFIEKMTSTETIADFVRLGGTPAADLGEEKEGLSAEVSSFKILAHGGTMSRPMGSWLSKPAWDQLISQILDIATGQEETRSVVDGVITLK